MCNRELVINQPKRTLVKRVQTFRNVLRVLRENSDTSLAAALNSHLTVDEALFELCPTLSEHSVAETRVAVSVAHRINSGNAL